MAIVYDKLWKVFTECLYVACHMANSNVMVGHSFTVKERQYPAGTGCVVIVGDDEKCILVSQPIFSWK